MKAATRLWLHFLRLWVVIDLSGAKRTGNWPLVSDCRVRIAQLDQKLDLLEVTK
jgi:hypothetical protein